MNDCYTPIHNEVLEALCKINLSPYETRVLFAIWRKTYGYVDKKTGLRKKYDFIAYSQITDITNIPKSHVSRSVKGLIEKKIISKDKKKIAFSKEFMKLMLPIEVTNQVDKLPEMVTNKEKKLPIEVIEENKKLPEMVTEVTSTGNEKLPAEALQKKERNYINSITTDVVITKEEPNGEKKPLKRDTNYFIGLFKCINPSYDRLFRIPAQRQSMERLLKKYGEEKMERMLLALPEITSRKYAPTITTPYNLEAKIGDLLIFLRKEKYGQPKIAIYPGG